MEIAVVPLDIKTSMTGDKKRASDLISTVLLHGEFID